MEKRPSFNDLSDGAGELGRLRQGQVKSYDTFWLLLLLLLMMMMVVMMMMECTIICRKPASPHFGEAFCSPVH
jgi:hypothetical protein